MAADDLATQGARTSAAMILPNQTEIIQFPYAKVKLQTNHPILVVLGPTTNMSWTKIILHKMSHVFTDTLVTTFYVSVWFENRHGVIPNTFI